MSVDLICLENSFYFKFFVFLGSIIYVYFLDPNQWNSMRAHLFYAKKGCTPTLMCQNKMYLCVQLNLICITDLSLVVWVLKVDCENQPNQKQGQWQRTKVFWAVVKTTTSVKSFSEFFISFSQPLLWFKVLETLVRPKNFMTTSVSLLSFFFVPSPTEVWKTAQFPLTRCQNQRQEES